MMDAEIRLRIYLKNAYGEIYFSYEITNNLDSSGFQDPPIHLIW
jgi:hypothetical protein